MEMANFPYRPLDLQSHEIRILNLRLMRMLPESLGKSDPGDLLGALEHVSLVDPGPYIALSYCWGDRNNSQWLKISPSPGASFLEANITDNLASALWALWNRKRDGETRLRIWVDAICINQNDLYERSQQVQVMRQIYSKATSVVAWVDPFDHNVFLKNRDRLSNLYAGEHFLNKELLRDYSEGSHSLKDFFDEMYWKVSNRHSYIIATLRTY
jgi:hypothetical protein